MTDAALPVTEQAVERFVESYLTSLGAEIEKEGRQWSVTLSEDADTDLDLDGAVLEVTRSPDDVSEGVLAIAPQSPFVERVLDEAADRAPVGSLSLTGEQVDIELPPWITEGPVDVVNRTFTPYYDRRALCVLFHVGIETVSEYQREELYAVAIDLNDNEERPQLAETYLALTEENKVFNEGEAIDERVLTDALDVAHATVEDDISPLVRETRERATRSAEVELDEYRQFVRQRRDELAEEIDRLTTRIEEVTDTIDVASEQRKRVEALRKRKELQAERDELRAELDELASQIEANFPEKRQEIRDRHTLTVRIRPVTATVLSYERGDLDLELQLSETEVTKSYAYAVGTGVMEEVACEQCGRQLIEGNPLTLDGDEIVGVACCDE
jgi:hypothetical protein